MPLNFENAIVYDIETFPNCFTFAMSCLHSDLSAVWEISQFRDDRKELLQFFNVLNKNQIPMIGFNNVGFDYPVIHMLWKNPSVSYAELYKKAMEIIESQRAERNAKHSVWVSNRFAPQVDLFKIYHFDNPNKATSLKKLQITMRSETVVDMPIKEGTVLTEEQIKVLRDYNMHDVTETKKFGLFSKDAILFRQEIENEYGIDVYNWNDTKIGEELIITRLGDDVCYDYSSGKKRKRQTPRTQIALKDVILPNVSFKTSPFQKIHEFFKNQVLLPEEIDLSEKIDDSPVAIKTKGVFKNLKTIVDGVEYAYGTGGIHASIKKKRICSGDGFIIVDVDVSSLYPSISIANGLHPEHLGNRFVEVYRAIPEDRRKIQKLFGKKCFKANSLKLACNGAVGKSNCKHSVLYDPKYTMSITINGQLQISMLLEELLQVPTVKIIQANTDGITFYIHESQKHVTDKICADWQKLTGLILEENIYQKMFIRDAGSYIAVDTKGKQKLKGAYWTPNPDNYLESIANSQPPAWNKNLSKLVCARAAVANMLHGTPIEEFIRACKDPYDFICSVSAPKNSVLMYGDIAVQRNTRFYVSTEGEYLKKCITPKYPVGTYKRKSGVSEHYYNEIMKETGGEWDERVCSKNHSKYDIVVTSLPAGEKVVVCNDIADFCWDNLKYSWYVEQAESLLL